MAVSARLFCAGKTGGREPKSYLYMITFPLRPRPLHVSQSETCKMVSCQPPVFPFSFLPLSFTVRQTRCRSEQRLLRTERIGKVRILWAYAPTLHGLMRPCSMDLRTHASRTYASVLYGLTHPRFMDLCVRTLWTYAPMLHGLTCPCSPCFTA